MFTITCELRFKDGKSVTGRVEAQSPEAEYMVIYGGDVELLDEALPRRPAKSDAGFLEFLFRGWGAQLGAELSVKKEGTYERWAE